jgi:AraC family transcriptional regulator of adaptative response/methylated-DNA-[protein]-cysteine methyltransferase
VADDPRWARVLARDKAADGQFWYSVTTTGVYCRPSCPSRTANPKNVALHGTLASAKATGFRSCKRCHPDGLSLDDENAKLVAKACRLIEENEEQPSLDELAGKVGRSSSYFHRVFKAVTGLTPKDYAAAHQAAKVRQGLETGTSVTGAMYDAGFNSSGRFYATSTERLGMTPSAFRSGGCGAAIRFAVGECSLGAILVAATEKGICAISFGDDPDRLVRDLQDRFPKAELIGGDEEFERHVAEVVGFIEAPEHGLNLPLDVRGTAFQQRVWQALRTIPAGVRTSYRDIAERIGAPKAVRAVAQACAANKLAVAIPCHRVVRNDGGLSGYRWGVERKRALLEREAKA